MRNKTFIFTGLTTTYISLSHTVKLVQSLIAAKNLHNRKEIELKNYLNSSSISFLCRVHKILKHIANVFCHKALTFCDNVFTAHRPYMGIQYMYVLKIYIHHIHGRFHIELFGQFIYVNLKFTMLDYKENHFILKSC